MEAFLKSPEGQALIHGIKVAVYIGLSAAITSILGFLAHDPLIQTYIAAHFTAFALVSVVNVVLASSLKYLQVK